MAALWRLGIAGALMTLATAVSAGQAEPPQLSRQQRAALKALVSAVDASAGIVDIPDDNWPVHLLRASDGSHYVAFSLNRADGLTVGRPLVVYVRLATRADSTVVERSAVAEWLAGQTPAPVLPRRGIALGEMPTYGAGSIATRGPGAQTQNLQLLELERERAREKREAQERARKAALEGTDTTRVARPLLPFEDFDLEAHAVTDRTGAPVLRRSLTAGPGEYDLTVAWVELDAKATAPPRVVRRRLSLGPASTTALALSSVILADDVAVRETPVAPADQTAHPYSIGPTAITPARDHVLTPDERLALVVQVINARAAPSGKPDVTMGFRVFRRDGAREQNIGSLAPQLYNEVTLPFDFDVRKGHPIFAAVAVPLRSFKRGDYRLEIAASDRVAGAGVLGNVAFSVVATPATLLGEAPPLAPAFDPALESLSMDVPIMVGALRASEGNDREAIAAWQSAIDGGGAPAALWPLMVDAYLRLGDSEGALDLVTRGLQAVPADRRLMRQRAVALLMSGDHDDALRTLAALRQQADDLDLQWLTLRALFAGFVSGQGAGSSANGRAELIDLAGRYVAAGGPHAALAGDWATAVR